MEIVEVSFQVEISEVLQLQPLCSTIQVAIYKAMKTHEDRTYFKGCMCVEMTGLSRSSAEIPE